MACVSRFEMGQAGPSGIAELAIKNAGQPGESPGSW